MRSPLQRANVSAVSRSDPRPGPGLRLQITVHMIGHVAAVADGPDDQACAAHDPQINLRLKANAALRTALVDRVDAYYQSEIVARLPGVRDRLASLLSREMTSTQLLATGRMLSCETGRRLVERGLKNALAESLGREVADGLSDAEAEAMVAKNDIPVIMEFSRTGADVKFEKIAEEMEGMQADLFEPILQGEEDFILNVLEELISVSKNAI